jgi:multicomponent Na+:H+ antiporter subunit B
LKKLALIAVLFIGIILFWAVEDMPAFGDPDAPANHYVARMYIERTLPDIGIDNIVTAILASYRGFDTLGETVVIFTAGISVILLLRRSEQL